MLWYPQGLGPRHEPVKVLDRRAVFETAELNLRDACPGANDLL
jgi:hypothetical protein